MLLFHQPSRDGLAGTSMCIGQSFIRIIEETYGLYLGYSRCLRKSLSNCSRKRSRRRIFQSKQSCHTSLAKSIHAISLRRQPYEITPTPSHGLCSAFSPIGKSTISPLNVCI